MFKNAHLCVSMLTLWLSMCSTVAPMARGVGGDLLTNELGQWFTRSSTFTHLMGASGAPIGLPSGAADRTRDSPRAAEHGIDVSLYCTAFRVPLSAPAAKNRVRNAFGGTENVLRMLFNHM